MSKLQIISDKNKKSSKIKNLLLKKINSNHFKKENLIIVIGGDGFMLQTLKKNKNSRKHFYGINSGNYGFLMNKFSSKDIIKNLSKANLVSISPLLVLIIIFPEDSVAPITSVSKNISPPLCRN